MSSLNTIIFDGNNNNNIQKVIDNVKRWSKTVPNAIEEICEFISQQSNVNLESKDFVLLLCVLNSKCTKNICYTNDNIINIIQNLFHCDSLSTLKPKELEIIHKLLNKWKLNDIFPSNHIKSWNILLESKVISSDILFLFLFLCHFLLIYYSYLYFTVNV